jgi:hypothetical protein
VLAPWKIFSQIALAIRLSFSVTVARGSTPASRQGDAWRSRGGTRVFRAISLSKACSSLPSAQPYQQRPEINLQQRLISSPIFLFRALALLFRSKVALSYAPASSWLKPSLDGGSEDFRPWFVEGWKNSPSVFSDPALGQLGLELQQIAAVKTKV